MDETTRRQLIDRYKDGPHVVADALAGATDAELDAHPAPGKRSARQIVHHLADSEMTSAIRVRMLVALNRPVIQAYDQEVFAERLHYDRPIAASLEAFRLARVTTAEVLERLDDADWQRAGSHPEHARYTVEDWLRIYAAHAHDHADQIARARASTAR